MAIVLGDCLNCKCRNIKQYQKSSILLEIWWQLKNKKKSLHHYQFLGYCSRNCEKDETFRLHFGTSRDPNHSRNRLDSKTFCLDETRHRGQRAGSSHRSARHWSTFCKTTCILGKFESCSQHYFLKQKCFKKILSNKNVSDIILFGKKKFCCSFDRC